MVEQATLKYPEAGRGEWDDEPDQLDFVASGCDCTLRRGPCGHWCGYVKVAAGHILHGVEHSTPTEALAEALEDRKDQPLGENPGLVVMIAALCGQIEARPDTVFQVHGGITFSKKGVVKETDGEWWYGFDCNHCDDFAPGYTTYGREGTYRNMAYARSETESLAAQIAILDTPSARPAVEATA